MCNHWIDRIICTLSYKILAKMFHFVPAWGQLRFIGYASNTLAVF